MFERERFLAELEVDLRDSEMFTSLSKKEAMLFSRFFNLSAAWMKRKREREDSVKDVFNKRHKALYAEK